MSVAIAIVAPLAAALFCLAWEDSPFGRWAASIAMLAGAGAAGTAAGLSATAHEAAWRGFTADPWRGFLAAGALLCAAAAAVHGSQWRRAAICVHAALTAAVVLSPNLLWVGLLLATGAAAFVVAAWTGENRPAAIRSAGWLALTDVAVLAALVGSGDALGAGAAGIDGWAAWVVLVAGAIKIGLIRSGEALAVDGVGAAWMGPVRAQGALLIGIALRAGGGRGLALAAAGAAVAGVRALAPLDDDKVISSAGAAVMAAGFGLGGPAATTGALLVLAASFAGWAVRAGGRAGRLGTFALSAAPGGGAFAGTMLVAGAAAQAAAARPGYLAVAIPVAAVALRWLGAVAPERPIRLAPSLAATWVVPSLAALALLVATPALALRRFGGAAAASMGVGRFLGPDRFGVADQTGIVIAALVVLGFLVPHLPARRMTASVPAPAVEDRITPRGIGLAWTLAGAAAGLGVALFFVARSRGFL